MYFSGKDCGEPQILQHGEIVMAPSDTKYDSIISYACTEAGYELHGHPDVMCSANGTWTTQPECRSEYFGARWLSEYDADLKLALCIWAVCLTETRKAAAQRFALTSRSMNLNIQSSLINNK